MDPFRLLTRSANIKKPKHSFEDGKLPSQGQNAPPQLYGGSDDVVTASTVVPLEEELSQKKRKRESGSKDDLVQLPAALDFFEREELRPTAGDLPWGKSRDDKRRVPTAVSDMQIERDTGPGVQEMSLAERKRILKEHKIKIVRLAMSGSSSTVKAECRRTSREARAREKLTGKDAVKEELFPRPLSSFTELRHLYGISRRLAENISAQGFTIPTEVQMVSLPLLLRTRGVAAVDDGPTGSGVDLIAVAPTGSGKTLAYLIPVMEGIMQDRRSTKTGQGPAAVTENEELEGPKALIVVPTKELVQQVVNEGRKLALGTAIKISGVRKGVRVGSRPTRHGRDDLASTEGSQDEDENEEEDDDDDNDDDDVVHGRTTVVKADILVTTPLALLNALGRSSEKETIAQLPRVVYLVLDEADVLLDPLFREQTLAVWSACSNPWLTLTFWSATMGSSIEELVESRCRGMKRDGPGWQLVRLVIGIKDSAIPNVDHRLVYAATEAGKLLALRQLLHPSRAVTEAAGFMLRPPILVFTQTIARAIALHSELLYDIPVQAGGSNRIAVLHSHLSDSARDRVMTGFRQGEIWVVISTDLLSRGVDFRGVNGVVNYDIPTSTAAYVHRAGRTGRAGRLGGVVVTLYTVDDIPHVKTVVNVITTAQHSSRRHRRCHHRHQALTVDDDNHDNHDDDDHGGAHLPTWLLNVLPTPTKTGRKRLKRQGVESRRRPQPPPPPPSTPSTIDGHKAHLKVGGHDDHHVLAQSTHIISPKTSSTSTSTSKRTRTAARISTKSGYDRRLDHRRHGHHLHHHHGHHHHHQQQQQQHKGHQHQDNIVSSNMTATATRPLDKNKNHHNHEYNNNNKNNNNKNDKYVIKKVDEEVEDVEWNGFDD